MGVPAFYRWLVDKYPKVVVNAIEHNKNSSSNDLDVDIISLPNPNGYEFHNLYLDMNGIIHPCFHPDHLFFPPTTFEQVFENIFAYIDRLVRIVRPRKLLYLAIDGVAPRAKMNQQRSRRFKAAKDGQIAEQEETRLREEFQRKGKKLFPKLQSQISDSNVITPGTKFMHELSKALNIFIHGKLQSDPGWNHLEVILSDATVPGEGEHKIMSFIRSKRSLSCYDPNTRHCLYGLDADLIMLALATHELHFSILREDVLAVREQSPVSESTLHMSIQKAAEDFLAKSTQDKPKTFFDIHDKNQHLQIQPQHYQFLHVWILREYLELDMQIVDPPEKFEFDVERIIDDFVFICFYVGNDFLPHMPTLEIHENAIDLLMYVYKKEFKSLGGYLVDMQRVNDQHAGYIKLKRVEKFILSVGSYEEKIFKKRTEIRDKKLRRIISELLESEAYKQDPEGFEVSGMDIKDHEARNALEYSDIQEMLANKKELHEELKKCIRERSDIFRDGNMGRDKVKLGSLGWKLRYYEEKFTVEDPKEIEIKRKQIVQQYTEGLCWVLLYYYSGIPSWDWYYPEHYGPFASDLKGLAGIKVRFQTGAPFKPFDQLMAVLPPKSAHALPRVYQELMTDTQSNIIEFYPTDFNVDVDGKRFMWQGICILPFIDQEKLLTATKQLEQKVEEEEAERNFQRTDKLFIRTSNRCLDFELPEACFIPRLLEGIQPPEKTISEIDIKETVLWHEYSGRPPITRHYNRYGTGAAHDVGKNTTVNKSCVIRTAGSGRGFEAAGRGKGFTSNARQTHSYNVNERYASTAVPQSPSRGMENLRVSGGSWGTSTRNNMQSTRSVVPHENTSWRPVSYTRPSFTSQGSEGSLAQFRPRNANNPQFGVVQHANTSWQSVSYARPRFTSHYTEESSAQLRPHNTNVPQFMGRGRGRGRSEHGHQMYNQFSTGCPDYRDRNRW
ncbi:hypothetical protein BVRB_7g170950 [Beta vulgaris subsp. vulgaris]|nr:hypothetical protein BVRB_7g170950 [Beta vulgaris subsp. vulgaris]